jgi:hypothetical protein
LCKREHQQRFRNGADELSVLCMLLISRSLFNFEPQKSQLHWHTCRLVERSGARGRRSFGRLRWKPIFRRDGFVMQ